MTIPAAFLDEIRARVGLSTVVARTVKLTRAGREMKGCCPFHNEKTPSFYVNDDKGFYHCFGCGEHGSVIDWTIKQEGLAFRDAVESLAAQAGLDMPEESAGSQQRAQAAAGLHDVTARAAVWFAEQLASAGGTAARRYLDKRGLSAATVKDFGLGLAPDGRTKLKAALDSIGVAKLVETGMLIAPDDGGEPYDRFRGRLIFPIRDPRGRVIAFGGRILGDGQPKYLNSPDTPLFDKGRTLYNLDRAGPVARKSGRLLVVEGYMDVIGLAQAGIGEAVAPLGTALTEQQLQLLWRVVPEPVLCFDGDAAGQRAGLRAALRALPLLEPGQSLGIVTLPTGIDPDDFVRDRGVEQFNKLLGQSKPLYEFLWENALSEGDTTTPERRAAIKSQLREYVNLIEHRDIKIQYDLLFREKFKVAFESWGWNRPAIGIGLSTKRSQQAIGVKGVELEGKAILIGLLNFPDVAADNFDLVHALPLGTTDLLIIRDAITNALAWADDLNADSLSATLSKEGMDAPILGLRTSNRLKFSFNNPESSEDLAKRDLVTSMRALNDLHRIRIEIGLASRRYESALAGRDTSAEMTEFRNGMHTYLVSLLADRARIFEALYAYVDETRELRPK